VGLTDQVQAEDTGRATVQLTTTYSRGRLTCVLEGLKTPKPMPGYIT